MLPVYSTPLVSSLRRGLAAATVLLGCLGGTFSAQAQWNWISASNPDFPVAASQAVQVENTGLDHVPLDGKTLRVACWDGLKPGLGWSFSPDENPGATGQVLLQGVLQGGTATDPDIVADPADLGAIQMPVTGVLVTYVLNGRIVYEAYKYDVATNMVYPAYSQPQVIASGGSNPNVDINGRGQAVITWERGGAIFAMVYDLRTFTPYTPCLVAKYSNYLLSQPDVATGVEQGNNINTSFIFLGNDPNTAPVNRVFMVQVPSFALKTTPSVNTGVGTDVLPGVTGIFDAPRIAAGFEQVFTPTSFEAVVAELHDNNIYGLNTYNTTAPVSPGLLPTATILNQFGGLNLSGVGCYRPVVTYAADNIVVSWTADDSQSRFGSPNPNPTLNYNQEAAQTTLNWIGQPHNSNPPNAHYSIVNFDQKKNQAVPSVAARFATFLHPNAASSVSNRCSYAFFDEPQQEILIKSSDYANTSLRPLATRGEQLQPALSAYPNPFRQQTTLQLNLAAGETVQSLAVYGPTGQLVRQQAFDKAVGQPGTQQVQWDDTGLSSGLYLVRLRTSSGVLHSYRLQHE
jgi:hypothetical protein